MRPLTVLSVAYPPAPVGPDAVGGAEQVLHMLDAALVAAGHRSVVVAREDSRVAGALVPVTRAPGDLDDAARDAARAAARRAVAEAVRDHAPDVVHLHGLDAHWTMPPPGPPALVTLHLPPEWCEPRALRPERPRTWVHGVSAAQHAALVAAGARPLLRPIPNGVEVEALGRARHARRGFALMLARVCEEKGQHVALRAARTAGVPLLLGGEVHPYPAHRAYFEREVAPLLDGRAYRFLGPVGPARKRRLLSAARCLLVPSTVPETSGLAAMEAAACGTPVVAFPSGALRDTVEHDRTGFHARDEGEMAAAILRAGEIGPDECRRVARARFDAERTADAYISLYARLASGDALAEAA